METSDTKWNKKFRRDSPSEQPIENMDTMGLEEKIKNLFKQKLYSENIKNIELLKSIYDEYGEDEDEDEDEDKSKSKSKSKSKDRDRDEFKDKDKDTDKKKKEKEDIPKENTNESFQNKYIGCSSAKSTDHSSSNIDVEPFASIQDDPNVRLAKSYVNMILDKIFSFTTSIPIKIENKINYVSHILVETFSKFDNPPSPEEIKKNDKKIIKNTVYLFILFPVAIYIAYNLYFITALKHINFDTENDIKVPTRPATDSKRIKFKVDGWKNEEIWEYFLHYVIKPIDKFDSLFLGEGIKIPKNPYLASLPGLPKIFGILDSKLSFFILLLISLFLVLSPSLSILGLLKSIQSGIPTNIHYFFLAIKIPMFIMASIRIGVSYFSRIKPSVESILFFMGLVLGSFIIAFFSNKISILILLLFIWFHCFFGMVLYGNDSIFTRIYYGLKYVNLDLNKNKQSNVGLDSIFDKIGKFIQKYSIVLAFNIVLFIVFITTAFKLRSPVFSTVYKSFLIALMLLITLHMAIGGTNSNQSPSGMTNKMGTTTPLDWRVPLVPVSPMEPVYPPATQMFMNQPMNMNPPPNVYWNESTANE